jgi:hypothetical protein
VRSLRGTVYLAGKPLPFTPRRGRDVPAERRETARAAACTILTRFESLRAALDDLALVHQLAGRTALASLALSLARAIDRQEPSAFEQGHEAILRFADWLADAAERKPPAKVQRRQPDRPAKRRPPKRRPE